MCLLFLFPVCQRSFRRSNYPFCPLLFVYSALFSLTLGLCRLCVSVCTLWLNDVAYLSCVVVSSRFPVATSQLDGSHCKPFSNIFLLPVANCWDCLAVIFGLKNVRTWNGKQKSLIYIDGQCHTYLMSVWLWLWLWDLERALWNGTNAKTPAKAIKQLHKWHYCPRFVLKLEMAERFDEYMPFACPFPFHHSFEFVYSFAHSLSRFRSLSIIPWVSVVIFFRLLSIPMRFRSA